MTLLPKAKAVRSTVTGEAIQAALRTVGLRQGDTVLVHSSLSRFGYVEGGANTVIAAVLDTLGPDGTLLMSAITTHVSFVTACISAAEAGMLALVEPFDVIATTTYAGTIAETFRVRPDAKRSWHPTHSVSACGPLADVLIANHENAPGPCGEGTPYSRICGLDRGFILLLGVSHQANTTLHGIEELAGVEYVLFPKRVRIPLKTPHGQGEAHTRVHNAFMQRDLNLLETDYLDGMAEVVTHIGDSVVRLVHAKRMKDITLRALDKNPFCLLNANGLRAFHRMKETGVFIQHPFANPNS